MKNIRIGVKLVGGFVLTALLIIFVGVTALLQQGKLQHESEILEKEAVPAVRDILIIKSEAAKIASLMRTLLTPYANKEQRENVHQGLLEAREIYGKAKDRFQALPFMAQIESEWDRFNTHITKWATINNEAVGLSKALIEADMTNPTELNEHMDEFEIAHNQLLAHVGKLLIFNESFMGGTDATACTLGKWMEAQNTSNPEVLALIEEIKPAHAELHASVGKIKQLMADGESYQAREVAHNILYPSSEKVFDIVHKMQNLAHISYEKFERMNTLLLHDAAQEQAATFAAMDEIVKAAEAYAQESGQDAQNVAKTGRTIILAGLTAGTVLALALGFTLTVLITKPLFKGVDLAKAMASGDMTRTMDVDQKDEIGILASSLNDMARNLRSMIADVGQGVLKVDESSNQLAAISNQLSSGAENTANRSSQVAAAAEEMSANQDSVAAAMEQASVNVNMVASAAEEMNATISEIAGNSSRATEITTRAVGQSKTASERVDELGRAANEITKVTEAITEISEQTNLLALNATIEAARAGEAGKGFAVVANEIKDLAKQTAEATLDIKTKIQGIQEATGITVKEINEISAVITDVDQIVATIAAAVEEQTATTREIAENITQVSGGISEVNENVSQSSSVSAEIAADIAEVNSSAGEMNIGSNRVKDSAGELSQVAETLKQMVAKFKV